MSFIPGFSNLGAFLALFVGFSFIIFVHELGHFLAAKAVGIKVTQFAIGFGQSLLTWRRGLGVRFGSTEAEYEKRLKEGVDPAALGETEYRFNWLPLGGYVKMLGQEDLDPQAASQDPRSFTQKPVWARAVVLSAGVVMNVIFGLLFFVIAFTMGVSFPPAMVGAVVPNGPAAITYAVGQEGNADYQGLQPGDLITHVDGTPISDFTELGLRVGLAKGGQPLRLTVQRDGEDQPLFYRIMPRHDPDQRMLSAGIAPPVALTVQPGAMLPEEMTQAGIGPGWVVESVDGQPVARYDQYADRVAAAEGFPVDVAFVDPVSGQKVTVPVAAVPLLTGTEQGHRHLLGVTPATLVHAVAPRSPAERAGIRSGDLVARIGAVDWPQLHDVFETVRQADGNPVHVTVMREGELVDIGQVQPSRGILGIHMAMATDTSLIGRVLQDSPLDDLHLPGGSRILAIDNQPAQDFNQIQQLLVAAARAQQPAIEIRYQVNVAGDPTGQAELPLTEQARDSLLTAHWAEPLTPMNFDVLRVPIQADNPWHATTMGLDKTRDFMLHTYVTLVRLFEGTVPVSQLHGPVGIAHVGTRVARQGGTYLMFFLGLISVNLAVINFLPIPIVDGGHMVFLLIEKIKGSPVSARVQTAATLVGLALLGSVFLMTLFFDTSRILGSF